MGWCEREQTDCECVGEQVFCNSENCHRKLPDTLAKPFLYDPTGTGLVAGGNIYMPPPNTIQIDKCEKIILNQSGIDIKFEFNNDNIKKFKQFIINGVKFLRADSFCEDLLDELRKSSKEDLKWYDVEQSIYDVLEGYSK